MAKLRTPDTPLFDSALPKTPSAPPQSQTKEQQPGAASFLVPRRPAPPPPATPKRQEEGPTTTSETNSHGEFTFRLNSKDAPQPLTFFDTGNRGLNPWTLSKMPGVKVTIIPLSELKARGKEAEFPVTTVAPVLKKIPALPDVVEKEVGELTNATNAAPVKPVVEAKVSAPPSLGAAKEMSFTSASFGAPLPKIIEKKVAESSKTPKATPMKPVIEAQASTPLSPGATGAVPLASAPFASTPFRAPPLHFVEKKVAETPKAIKTVSFASTSFQAPFPDLVEKKFAESSHPIKTAPMEPVIEARASCPPLPPPTGAAKVVPFALAPFQAPLPDIVEKKFAKSSEIIKTAPMKPVVDAQASAPPTTAPPPPAAAPAAPAPPGAAKAAPFAPVLFQVPLPDIVKKKIAESSNTSTTAPMKPMVEAQTPAPPSLGAAKAVPFASASFQAPLSIIVEKQIAESSEIIKTVPMNPVPEAQASAPPPGAAKATPPVSIPLQAPLPEISLAQTQQLVRNPTFASQFEAGVGQLIEFSTTDRPGWEHLVGLHLQESGRTPLQVAFTTVDGGALPYPVQGLGRWVRDWRKVDEWDKYPTVADCWPLPAADSIVAHLVTQIDAGFRQQILEEAIRRWAMSNPFAVEGVARRAGYMLKCDRPREFSLMSDIKKMSEGPMKKQLLAQARRESPKFAQACMMDEFCGVHRITKRSIGHDGIEKEQEFSVYTTSVSRREELLTSPSKLHPEESPRKKLKMREPRPTQFHSVPLEERAVDSRGQTLPWSLEWHEDHPNARHQKRHHEETGSFGKRVRRRTSRSTTPAKKENPTLDGFEKALKYDQERAAAEAQEKSTTPKTHNESVTNVSSSIKVPTQVALYGYAPGTHWASIDFYERASLGSICEDYDRDPPIERRRIPNAFAAAQMVRSRALTRQEAVLARQYHGGNCWIKVTFDSAEAADRAINCSPHQIQGHWVYAELFRGVPPNHPDEPIPLRKEDLGRGPFGGAAPAPRASRSLGSSFAKNNKLQTRSIAGLSSSLNGTGMVQVDSQEPRDVTPQSSSTATSATATAPEYPDLRNRVVNQPVQNARPPQRDPRFFTHFPDVPRTILRPPHEAFLPQPTWLEACLQRLAATGWLPGDMIGDGPPFLDNGEFDWESASLYWKFFYTLDMWTWTNFCGTKD